MRRSRLFKFQLRWGHLLKQREESERTMRWLVVLMLVSSCRADADSPYVGSFAVCVGAGEASNLRIAPDGRYRWALDGCDYTRAGSGTWQPANQGITLIASG